MTKKILQPFLPAVMLPLLAATAGAQALTGTAHPEESGDSVVTTTDHYVKPSHTPSVAAPLPAVPEYQNSYAATGPTPEPTLLPRTPGSPVAEPMAATAEVPTPTAEIARRDPSEALATSQPVRTSGTPAGDAYDGAIVLEVPTFPHQLNRGTLLHARLRETVSTRSTEQGAIFTAELTENVGHHGEVMLPAGSLIRGRVASIHGGKRIGGAAAIRLQPETVSLPDGTLYRLAAQVTDLEGTDDVRVQDEGTVVQRTHPKTTLAVLGGVTGTAAVTGAVVGGGVGAAVGAVVGAGVATTWWLKRDVQETLPAGSNVIFALDQPLAVTPR